MSQIPEERLRRSPISRRCSECRLTPSTAGVIAARALEPLPLELEPRPRPRAGGRQNFRRCLATLGRAPEDCVVPVSALWTIATRDALADVSGNR